MLKRILQGVVVGIANIIPGVSGGTMLVSMGLYDRLIESITHLFRDWKKSVRFLLPIFIGAGLALVLLAKLFEYLLGTWPVPTNLGFCGLIAGSLPFILNKVRHKGFNTSMAVCFLLFFALVVGMALLGDNSGAQASVAITPMNVILLFLVGIIAAATMVIPGVSGSMMLMLLGYYEPILHLINQFVSGLIHFDMGKLLPACGALIPCGLGIVVGIFAVAKLIEWVMDRWPAQTYWAIIGLIVASPVAILLNTDWAGFSWMQLLIGVVTFGLGWFAASKLGGD
ncbi:DUF368 domain-containing protein [Faecalibaculum rodentium]|uniref:DUF368 domain-containing protein n=1 Tax=Faecalibaculum rodentium TaxID=1702221 RepID=UPI0024948D0C|nr:DUF368 domain-containing protein [Faecalibaculum rodentium]